MANRGGYRRNAGRPALGMTDKRVAFTCMVSPETKRDIEYLRGKGYKLGRMIDKWISDFTMKEIETTLDEITGEEGL